MSEIEDILKAHTPEIQQTVAALRALVKQVAPDLTEEGKRGWGNIIYKADEIICAISPHKAHVNVHFYNGMNLSDPEQLLEGNGQALRHIKIRSADSIPTGALTHLIQEACTFHK